MSVIQRYRNTIYGDIEFTGNSLLISRRSFNGSNYTGGITQFIATEPSDPKIALFPDYSAGEWSNNGSSATLNLSKTAKILYAELIWGGTYNVNSYGVAEEDLDNSIKMTLPDKTTHLINPLAATAFTQKLSGSTNAHSYTRSAVITDLVKQGGAGTYTVNAVPGINSSLGEFMPQLGLGWLIATVYEDKANCGLRSIRFYEGGSEVSAGGETKIVNFPGLYVGKNSSVLLASFAADPVSDKTTAEIQPTASGAPIKLFGPNNNKDSFFASQINDRNGNLNTGDTFGIYNFDISGNNPVGSFFARQGFDITRISLANILDKTYDSPDLLFKAQAGNYVLGAAAISSPEPLPTISVFEEHREISGMPGYCEYILKIGSTGNYDADNISVTLDLGDGFTLLDKSLTVGGFPKTGSSIVYPSSLILTAPKKGCAPIEISFIVGGFAKDLNLSPGKFKIKYILGNITSPETVYKLSAWKAGGQRMPQHEIGNSICQLLWDKLYAYNIDEVKNFEIQYRTAMRYTSHQSAMLSCNYTIKLLYNDKSKKEQLSVKNGSVSFFDFPDNFGENYTVKIIPLPEKLNGNEVIFKAVVRVSKQY